MPPPAGLVPSRLLGRAATDGCSVRCSIPAHVVGACGTFVPGMSFFPCADARCAAILQAFSLVCRSWREAAATTPLRVRRSLAAAAYMHWWIQGRMEDAPVNSKVLGAAEE